MKYSSNDFKEMIADIVEYYECAGFANFYEREVCNWDEERIISVYEHEVKDYWNEMM